MKNQTIPEIGVKIISAGGFWQILAEPTLRCATNCEILDLVTDPRRHLQLVRPKDARADLEEARLLVACRVALGKLPQVVDLSPRVLHENVLAAGGINAVPVHDDKVVAPGLLGRVLSNGRPVGPVELQLLRGAEKVALEVVHLLREAHDEDEGSIGDEAPFPAAEPTDPKRGLVRRKVEPGPFPIVIIVTIRFDRQPS